MLWSDAAAERLRRNVCAFVIYRTPLKYIPARPESSAKLSTSRGKMHQEKRRSKRDGTVKTIAML